MAKLEFFKRVLGCAWCACMLGACSSDDPCFPQTRDKTYRVTVIEPWTKDSRFPGGTHASAPCPADLDLVAGSTFDVRITGYRDPEGADCAIGEGTIVHSPEGWSWSSSGGYVPRSGGDFLEADFVSAGLECRGETWLSIRALRVPSGAAVPGRVPAATMRRGFAPDECPMFIGNSCSNVFVVEIDEL